MKTQAKNLRVNLPKIRKQKEIDKRTTLYAREVDSQVTKNGSTSFEKWFDIQRGVWTNSGIGTRIEKCEVIRDGFETLEEAINELEKIDK